MSIGRYHCIRQHYITIVGRRVSLTISKQYGLKIPISRIREVAGTDKQGTNAYSVIKAAEKLGFSTKGAVAAGVAINHLSRALF